jgi:peptidoglycan/xylan/chitin deacetylase (PgdA/CDA1 family)
MQRFTILMYHMIRKADTSQESRYACPPERFRQHIQKLLEKGYPPISLEDAGKALLEGNDLPEKPVVITLDDGFEDNYTAAFPILSEFSVPATIFLSTGHLGSSNQWMSSSNYPQRSMMNWEMVSEMARHGIDFGAHTVTHPRLSQLDNNAALSEIRDSKKQIEDKIGTGCRHFAYPYGDFGSETPGLVAQAGFTLACSTRSGFNTRGRNPFLLHRIEVYGNDSVWKLMQKMTFGHNDASLLFPLKYYTGRLLARLR